jgi:hypothetical protein
MSCSFEQLDRWEGWIVEMPLVDDLRLAISRQQDAEPVKGGHIALELDPVLEEHRHRNLMVLKMPEKHILNGLDPLYGHAEAPSFILVTAAILGASL